MFELFQSRDPFYKNPVGAVPEGTSIHFKIQIPRELLCRSARFCVRFGDNNKIETFGMFWCGMTEDQSQEFWECHFSPETRGLYHYFFEVETKRGTIQITRHHHASSELNNYGNWWQQTVYAKDLETPDWPAGGVMYQIFPDRFYASGKVKRNVPKDRWFHEDWLDEPSWRPDKNGEVTNSDYFGGDLKGIQQKLPYLQSLGVTCIYLNPIFEAHSNHRYNTADYSKIDPLLGTEADFKALCREAQKLGIHIILDGVFSHTGSDSVYFNQKGRYKEPGAYQSKESRYYPWYSFYNWPNGYESWWNFPTLPNVRETNPEYDSFINGDGGIVQKWLQAGASGWRLDVADELPDPFIDSLYASVKRKDRDALVLGEVWEDASNKTAYGISRRYLLGGQLDSVMNYPFCNAILGFLTGARTEDMMEVILNILENYPKPIIRLLMNHIGTHDTTRAITMLAGEPMNCRGREWQCEAHLTPEEWALGIRKLKVASMMQFTLPGIPCIYYGDEAGVEGYQDPFNRTGYPWGREHQELVEWYRRLGKMRSEHPVFKGVDFHPIIVTEGIMAYTRRCETEEILVILNSRYNHQSLRLPEDYHNAQVLFGKKEGDRILLDAIDCAVLLKQ